MRRRRPTRSLAATGATFNAWGQLTGNNNYTGEGGVLPDAVLSSYCNSTSGAGTTTIAGLNNSKRYLVRIAASRGNNLTGANITLGGVTGYVYHNNNKTNLVSFGVSFPLPHNPRYYAIWMSSTFSSLNQSHWTSFEWHGKFFFSFQKTFSDS